MKSQPDAEDSPSLNSERGSGGEVRLAYLANIRLPTEKAHGLQIVQMCEAFAQNGATVTLYAARRLNTPDLRGRDPYAFYGVTHNFLIRRLPCLDLHILSAGRFERIAFAVQTLTYTLFAFVTMLFTHADVYYSRDPLTVIALSLIKSRRRLVYEAHQVYGKGLSERLQRLTCRRAGLVVAITAKLGERMKDRGASHVLIAHDGYRAERFAGLPSRGEARDRLGLPPDALIVGYAGRLHTMGMSKGIDLVIEAVRYQVSGIGGEVSGVRYQVSGKGRPPDTGEDSGVKEDLAATDSPTSLARGEVPYFVLVGGPDDAAKTYQNLWVDSGLPPDRMIVTGTVPAAQIPLYLAAFDVAMMPLPDTEHFAFYTSAIKLFEYMAAGCTILATNLPAVAEVVTHEESALLATPGDVASMAENLGWLLDDPALRARLATHAKALAPGYTWERRARNILVKIEELQHSKH